MRETRNGLLAWGAFPWFKQEDLTSPENQGWVALAFFAVLLLIAEIADSQSREWLT